MLGTQKSRHKTALDLMLAEWTGLEPATPGVTGRYSNQLNYHSSSKTPKNISGQRTARIVA